MSRGGFVNADQQPNAERAASYVVRAEPCGWVNSGRDDCKLDPCNGCLGDGTRLDLSTARKVERVEVEAWGYEDVDGFHPQYAWQEVDQ